MSYLKSVLSSIGVDKPPGAPTPAQAKSPGLANGFAPNKAVGGGVGAPVQAVKRKASSDAVSTPTAKAPRTEPLPNGAPRYTGTSRPISTPPVTHPSSTGPDALPYRGTLKPATPSTATSKPIAKVSNTDAKSAAPAAKVAPKPTVASNSNTPASTTAAPKKGSYQAMLARAKAAQQAAPVVGIIKHKQTEKLSKKDILAQKEEARKQALANKNKPKVAPGRPTQSGAGASKPGDVNKDKPKVPASGYTGTMRPKAPEKPAYTGTMKSGPVARPQRPPPGRTVLPGVARRPGQGPSTSSYARYKDEEDEEEEEEEDYASDGSSDMEAGAFDVDEEEEFSLRQARREDDAAAKEEAELKRQKQLRMQKLAAEAAKRKKRF